MMARGRSGPLGAADPAHRDCGHAEPGTSEYGARYRRQFAAGLGAVANQQKPTRAQCAMKVLAVAADVVLTAAT
jgi:hypothetical protein